MTPGSRSTRRRMGEVNVRVTRTDRTVVRTMIDARPSDASITGRRRSRSRGDRRTGSSPEALTGPSLVMASGCSKPADGGPRDGSNPTRSTAPQSAGRRSGGSPATGEVTKAWCEAPCAVNGMTYTDTEGRPSAAAGECAVTGHGQTTECIVMHAAVRPEFGSSAHSRLDGCVAVALARWFKACAVSRRGCGVCARDRALLDGAPRG